jgi:2-polyprenyl-6-methoxyphenol hydroxylase-like FAD-dependent oxidoreductase
MKSVDVAIIGGGAVGLFLGCRLKQLGISFCIFEAAPVMDEHSRAIGIHPPSLEMLEQMELASSFVAQGVRLTSGRAYADDQPVGELPFSLCPEPFPFVLSLAQQQTESLLAARVGDALLRGEDVRSVEDDGDRFCIHSTTRELSARFMVGCDGANSFVREWAGIGVSGAAYPDTFVMGDFAEYLSDPEIARIYLHREGLVEAFALNGDRRRWVCATPGFIENPRASDVCDLLAERVGVAPDPESCSFCSSFGVQRQLADRVAHGRLFLAGDAAHVMSPFGGQGMNVGWMDSRDLSDLFERVMLNDASLESEGQAYDAQVRKRAQKAIRRAEWNLRLGRASRWSSARGWVVGRLLASPLRGTLARQFTMRGLH